MVPTSASRHIDTNVGSFNTSKSLASPLGIDLWCVLLTWLQVTIWSKMTFSFRTVTRSCLQFPPGASVFHPPAPEHWSCSTWKRMIILSLPWDVPGNSVGRSEGPRGCLHKSLNQLAMQMQEQHQLFQRQRPFIFCLLFSCFWEPGSVDVSATKHHLPGHATKVSQGTIECAGYFQKASTWRTKLFYAKGLGSWGFHYKRAHGIQNSCSSVCVGTTQCKPGIYCAQYCSQYCAQNLRRSRKGTRWWIWPSG